MAFDDDTALIPDGDGAYAGNVVETWTARTALGGYVMAIVLRGLALAAGERGAHPRSLTVQFLRSPVPGPVTVKPVIEREGRSLTSASGRLEQDGKLMALALATFSELRGEDLILDEQAMPVVEPPGPRVAVSGTGDRGDNPPAFTQQVAMQPRFGERFFSGAESSVVGGWLGLVEERPIDALTLCVLADTWFPTPWPRLTEFRPAPTIELTVYFRAPLPAPDGLVLGRFVANHIRGGFFDEDGELWAPDGTLLAQSRQLALLLAPPV